jgi:ankyrin repeat protein
LYSNLVNPNEEDITSSRLISNHIDLNYKDKEGTTPICFAFKSNKWEIVELLMLNLKTNINLESPKFGCPLHFCILKHKFQLAI